MLKKYLGESWRTSLQGWLALLLSVPVLVNAVYDWANHKPVDWRYVIVASAMMLAGKGLTSAKDSNVHSTITQVEAATVKTMEPPPDKSISPSVTP